jgi:hypothetical protein
MSIFAILQSSVIQNKIVNLLGGGHVKVEFRTIKGLFPFSFFVKDLSISSDEFDMSLDTMHVKIAKNLFRIKTLHVDKLNITTKIDGGLSTSDLKVMMPILVQKIIKTASVDSLNVDGYLVKNLSFIYDKHTSVRCLRLNANDDAFMASWQFKENNILANVIFRNLAAHITYKSGNRHLNVAAKYQSKEFTFDGKCGDNFLTGMLTVPFNDMKFMSKISLKNGQLESELLSKVWNVSGRLSYDLSKKFLLVDNVFFGNGAIVEPFSVNDDGTVSTITIVLKDGKIFLKDINLSEDDFSLGSVKFIGVDVSQFCKADITGTLSGSGEYSNNVEKLKLKLSNFTFNSVKIPNIDVDASYSKDKINLKVFFDFLKRKNRLESEILIDNWLISTTSKIKATLSGTFDVAKYELNQSNIISGKLSYDVRSDGDVSDPKIYGKLILSDGIYINQISGTYIRDIIFDCSLKNNEINLKKIYARDDSKSPGQLNGTGNIVFTKDGINMDVSIKFDNLKAVEQNWLSARFDGDIRLKGLLLKDLKLFGNVSANNSEIDISSLVILSSRAIDLIKPINAEYSSSENHFILPLECLVDIKFTIKQGLKITGYGVDSLWNGGATICGNINDLQCNAKAVLEKGKIVVSDNKFKLKNGEILFDSTGLNVNVSAEKKLTNKVVGARFFQNEKGTKVKFFSSPYMSKKDILSYMLFDKSSADISTGEGLTLFSVMNQVSGGNSGDIVTKFKTTLCLDSIAIRKNTNNKNGEYDAVSIGKKIGKLRVSVDQGAAKATTSVVVETNVAKNTKISVDLSGKESVGAGISWSKRY